MKIWCVTDNVYFNPGQDHIIAVNNGGTRFGNANNIQIITQFINTVKNQGTEIDAMKWLFFELQKHNDWQPNCLMLQY